MDLSGAQDSRFSPPSSGQPAAAGLPPEVLIDALPFAAALLTPDLRIRHSNAPLTRLTGLPRDECMGHSISEVLHTDPTTMQTLLQRALHAGQAVIDHPVGLHSKRGPDEHAFWLLSLHPLPAHDGLEAGLLLLLRDVQQDSAQAIHAAEMKSRRVLDTLFAFVGLMTPDGTVLDANLAPLQAAGISIDDVRGKKVWDTYWFCHDPALQESMRIAVKAAERGEVSRYDMVVRMKDDSRMAIDFMLAPLRNEMGQITHLVPSAIDISARKSGEEALSRSEERFRCVVEAAPDGLAMVNRDGRLALVNSGMERLFGYSRQEMIGQPIEMLMPERYRGRHVGLRSSYMQAPTTRDMAGRRELYARRKDGSEFPVEIGLNALTTAGGEHVLATIADVTTRKADQALLERAVTEKTALLNEVHHRVKNNLQVICSLLNLQARTAASEAKAVLDDSQNRVKAMALIHQLLYERSDFSSVQLSVYLGRLASLLREALGEARSRVTVNVNLGNADISMDLQRSVPCGLLVNELVTNAIKHAFPDDRHGSITIRAELVSDKRARIVVEDDGIGVPPHIEIGHVRSLGFQLMPLLVDQLGGELLLLRDKGSRFELYFTPGLEKR
ncbi:MAG: PAS domain S-box protein [Rhodocyclaceae bacterium]